MQRVYQINFSRMNKLLLLLFLSSTAFYTSGQTITKSQPNEVGMSEKKVVKNRLTFPDLC